MCFLFLWTLALLVCFYSARELTAPEALISDGSFWLPEEIPFPEFLFLEEEEEILDLGVVDAPPEFLSPIEAMNAEVLASEELFASSFEEVAFEAFLFASAELLNEAILLLAPSKGLFQKPEVEIPLY